MKIWHVGAASSPLRVDGVSRTVWLLSREQAKLGHDVRLVVDTPPDAAAVELARDAGLTLIHVDSSYLNYAEQIREVIADEKPDIVHMHSVFIVRHATLGHELHDAHVPYLITPHGGLAPQVLRRGVVKKTIYAVLRERPRFMGSSAVALVTPAEERAVRSFIPHYPNPIRWMPNPVEVDQLDPHRWQGIKAQKRLAFLGRFDVLVKGIDILVEIARLLPEIKFDLYGTEDPKTLDWLNRLRENLPGNVAFHDPIFGLDKAKMLSQASLYLQPSRWEGFPVSVAECLYLGVPSAIADTLDLAQLFNQHHLGLVFPLDPPRAAEKIKQTLADENCLREWSKRGRQFALENFHPQAVAEKNIALYEEVISTRAASNGHSRVNGRGAVPPELRNSIKYNVSRAVERTHQLLGGNGHPRTIVLCYHSINRSAADLSVDPAVFRKQLVALQAMGFQFTGFGDLVERVMRGGAPRSNLACITFDDGYEDNLTQAAPILKELNVPGTVFVTTGLMTGEQAVIDHFHKLTRYQTTYLSPVQVGQLAKLGVEIGAHTHTHRNLARLTDEQARDEAVRSKALLEQAIGRPVRSFAYPFGKRDIHYTPSTVEVVRESGFSGAAAVAFRGISVHSSVRIFEVPRFFVTRADTAESFAQKISGHFDWLGSIQEHTPAWLKAMVSPEDRM